MKNSTNWIKKLLCLSLVCIKFSFGSLFSQECNPDIIAAFLSAKSNYTVYLDVASEYNLKAEELVSLCIDNCTTSDKMRYSFSEDASDNERKIQRNSNFPLTLKLFATDQAGNIAKADGQISIVNCTPTLACNDAIKFSILKGGNLPLTVDHFLEGSYCSDHSFEISYKNGSNFTPIVQIDESLPREFLYRVKDLVTGNSCWGEGSFRVIGGCEPEREFEIWDHPVVTTNCIKDADPSAVGFPFHSQYKVEETAVLQTYDVEYNPDCPRISVSYTDQLVTKDCADPYTAEITRIWTFNFPDSSKKQYTQLLKFERSLNGLFSTLYNYDGDEFPKLNCKDKWARKDGIPLPEFSGRPISNSCVQMEAKYDDLILPLGPTPCEEEYKIIRTWSVTNTCSGEVFNHNQIFKIYCSPDTISPVAICNEKATFSVPTSGQFTLFPDMIDNGSYDNCGNVYFSFDKEQLLNILQFNILDAGKTVDVSLFVTDLSGNQTFCIASVNIVFKGNGPNTKNIVGGKLLNFNLESIGAQNKIKYSLFDEQNIIPLYACGEPANKPNLDYSLCIDTANISQSGYLIPEMKFPTMGSGVTTSDIAKIIRNLLGFMEFNSYEAIAADVNCDNKINIFDIFELRRFILGIINNLNCDEVQFYSDNSAKPELIKDIKLDNLPRFDFNIVPVKKGDLHGIFARKTPIEVRSPEMFSFFIDNFNVKTNQIYDIWVRSAEEYKVYGVQIGQLFDENKIVILDISSPLQNLVKDSDYAINTGGDWRCLLINPTINLMTISGGFLKIRVRSRFDGMVSEAMSSTHFPIPLFVISSDIELAIPTIEFKALTSTADKKIDNLGDLTVIPNPFSDHFKIEINEEFTGATILEIYTMEGKKLFQNNYSLTGLANSINMNANVLPEAGVYLMVLNNGSRIYKQLLIKK